MRENPIMVSIVCNTYNHEKYIRDALEGFVNQKTDFNYEILVYDDASTDNTAEIIKEYEEKYPELISPVYQKVNQYSRGLRPSKQNRERAVGKYIALCEGDDYWIDEYKLQKQVDYMESHPECTFCFTNGFVRYGDQLGKQIVPWDSTSVLKKDCFDYDAGEVELLNYIPTASFLFPRSIKYPTISEKAFQGDTFHKLAMTSQGYAHFFDENMCVYRRAVEESATAVWLKDREKYISFCEAQCQLFKDMDEVTGGKYADVLKMRICHWEIEKYYTLEDYKTLKKIKVKEINSGNNYTKYRLYFKCKFPRIFKYTRVVVNKIKGVR